MLNGLPPAERLQVEREAYAATKDLPFIPNPGKQTDAYFCEADVLLFGGEGGGGKSGLGTGIAFTEHQNSLILRRQYTDLGELIEQALKWNGGRKGFNGSNPPSLVPQRPVIPSQKIDFGAAAKVGDEQHWQGRPHDLIYVDEATQFAEQQIRFFIGWLRTTRKGQRCRMILGSNPPLSAEGLWIVQMFAPWLDPEHPYPAKEGELRWAVSDEQGKHKWVDGPAKVRVGDKLVKPMSYTFIRSGTKDNPFISEDYEAKLDAMAEPFRSAIRDGNFLAAASDRVKQVIPTKWIREAQARWTPTPPRGIPQCAIGVDPAGGGEDNNVFAIRHDGWYGELMVIPGKETPTGTSIAGEVIALRRDNSLVVLDMGGGYGGVCYSHLKENNIDVFAYKGAEKSMRRTSDGKLKFINRRSEAYWRFREALDPGIAGGSTIALPPDPELVADLAAPAFEVKPNGIQITPKEKLIEELGRSPDKGDAVVMAWYSGAKIESNYAEWQQAQAQKTGLGGRMPQVLMGRQHYSTRRR